MNESEYFQQDMATKSRYSLLKYGQGWIFLNFQSSQFNDIA